MKRLGLLLFLGIQICLASSAFARTEGRIYSERFVRMDPIIVPIVLKERIHGYYFIRITLEAKTSATVASIEAHRPRIMDAINTNLYGLLGVVWQKESEPGLAPLKKRIEETILSVAGADSISQVFIEKFNRHLVGSTQTLMDNNVQTLF